MSEIKNKSEVQVAAEADVEEHRKDLGSFVVAAETTRMAMLFTDAKEAAHPIVFAKNSFLSLTGFDRAELLGKIFSSLMAAAQGARKAFHIAHDSFTHKPHCFYTTRASLP